MFDPADLEAMLLLGGWTAADRDTAQARAEAAALVARYPHEDPARLLNAIVEEKGAHWRRRVATGQTMVRALLGGEMGRLPPRQFNLVFERTFHLQRLGRQRLRIPCPITPDASVELLSAPGQTEQQPGRVACSIMPLETADAYMAARFSFTSDPLRERSSDKPDARHLSHREGLVAVTEMVKALADQLISAGAPAAAQVAAFRAYAIDNIRCGMVPPHWISGPATDWVVAHRWMDCQLGAALMTALCRARGIPARMVGGYLLWEAPMEHYWMEAWLPDHGWWPVDLLASDLSAAGEEVEWRGIYDGWIDYRMVAQRFPDVFTGAPMAGWPAAVHRLSRAMEGGTETRFVDARTGALLMVDTIRTK